MYFHDELFLKATLAEHDRERDALRPGLEFLRLNRAARASATRPQLRSTEQRAQQMAAELYGPGQPIGTDLGLFSRLAWVGIED